MPEKTDVLEREVTETSQVDDSSDTTASQTSESTDQQEQAAVESAQTETTSEDAQEVTQEQADAGNETAQTVSRTDRRKEQIANDIQELLAERAKQRELLKQEQEGLKAPIAAALRGPVQQPVAGQPPAKSAAVTQLEAAGQALQQATQNGVTTDSPEYARLYQNYHRQELAVIQEQAVNQAVETITQRQSQQSQFEQQVTQYSQTLAHINNKFPFLKPPVNGQVQFDQDAPIVKVAQQLMQERGLVGTQITPLQQLDLLKDAALELATSDTTLAKAALKQTQNKARQVAARTGLETGSAGGGGSTAAPNRLTALHKAAMQTPDGSEAWDAYFDEKIRLGERSRQG